MSSVEKSANRYQPTLPDQFSGHKELTENPNTPGTQQIISTEEILKTSIRCDWQALVDENRRLQELNNRYEELDILAKLSQIQERRTLLFSGAFFGLYKMPFLGRWFRSNLRGVNQLATQASETSAA